jgi:hypothetical protein
MAVRSVIARRRETFSHLNVRIHLDQVSGCGAYLQLETGLCHQFDAPAAGAQLLALATEFGITAADVLSSSFELLPSLKGADTQLPPSNGDRQLARLPQPLHSSHLSEAAKDRFAEINRPAHIRALT